MKYQLIDEWKKKAKLVQLCTLFEVSRSGYYHYQSRQKCTAICMASVQVKAAFTASGSVYGSRRLVLALKEQAIAIGRYKVRRIMRAAQLTPVWKRKFVVTTDSKHTLPIADNILNRQFNPSTPKTAWTSDIIYVHTETGWLYLAAVMELYSRKIIGWSMGPSMPSDLVCSALQMALNGRKPPLG